MVREPCLDAFVLFVGRPQVPVERTVERFMSTILRHDMDGELLRSYEQARPPSPSTRSETFSDAFLVPLCYFLAIRAPQPGLLPLSSGREIWARVFHARPILF